jgi:hypothetical protein
MGFAILTGLVTIIFYFFSWFKYKFIILRKVPKDIQEKINKSKLIERGVEDERRKQREERERNRTDKEASPTVTTGEQAIKATDTTERLREDDRRTANFITGINADEREFKRDITSINRVKRRDKDSFRLPKPPTL